MFNISSYLEKFKNLGQGERFLKQTIKSCLKDTLSIDLDLQNITLKNGEVIFKVSPAIKNAIFIKKDLILKKMTEKGIKNVNNLR